MATRAAKVAAAFDFIATCAKSAGDTILEVEAVDLIEGQLAEIKAIWLEGLRATAPKKKPPPCVICKRYPCQCWRKKS
jgi:hypothetical protein